MNIGTRAIIGTIGIVVFIYFTNSSKNENKGLTNEQSDVIMKDIENAFDKAELEILDGKPEPDDKPLRPDPDPKKCICQGTGKIIQGDGHVTSCPYHGSKDVPKCKCGCDKDGCDCVDGSCKEPIPAQPNYTPQRRGIFGGRLFGR